MQSSASITVDRPIEDVYAYISNVENMANWADGVRNVRYVSGAENEVGATYTSEYTYSGRTTEMSYEITAVEPPNRFAMVGTGPFPFEGELLLTATPTGTRVTNSIDAGADGRFTKVMFTVLGPLMRRLMAGQLGKELEILKGELESTPSTEATA
ncbi:SRPBCC family protein [Haladaptatus sp. YSMS36]|uniref:SRPBCC family protein n=2 Tax=Haladaptatus TaxID=367188 RepID=UPI0023E7A0C1|nr:SRPBCC family protein [Haladaptatus sp. YSMS36]